MPGAMADPPTPPTGAETEARPEAPSAAPAGTPAEESRRIVALAARDRNAARRLLALRSVEDQVALVCETPLPARRALLDLLPAPERVVPALPEAEFCFTVKALGLDDAAWIVALASEEQLVAALDLDAWSAEDLTPDRGRLAVWLATLAEAGEETLLRGAHALDPELQVLWLSDRIEVALRASEPEWEPPAGSDTLEGQFFFRARRDGDDLADVRAFLDALFREDYWSYFRLLQGVTWELPTETEEWALRWRTGRLLDLGFPTPEEAQALYAVLPAKSLDALPASAESDADTDAWRLPIWMPRLPVSEAARHSIFRALAALGDAERAPFLYTFISLANRIAVADHLPLGDAETIPQALDKAAEHASRGLEHLAAAHGLPPQEVLRRSTLERLFRVGYTLARSGQRAERRDPGRDGPK